MQTNSPYPAYVSEAILRDRVMSLVALYAAAARRARAEHHPRMRELRWVHAALIESRLCIVAEHLFKKPMTSFEDVITTHHATLH